MNIVFVGGFFPKQYENIIFNKSKHLIQNSANTFQWAFINGLQKNHEKPIKLITAPFVGWFPKFYKDLFIKTVDSQNLSKYDTCSMVGFLNIPIFKNIFKYFGIRKNIKSKLEEENINIIIVYSLNAAYLKAALDAKSFNANTKVCVIIPDLHEFHGDASALYHAYIKYIEIPMLYNLLSRIDSFVVLTDKMIDYLDISHKPWVRIEGLFDVQDQPATRTFDTSIETKNILYTGTLGYKYGIQELLDAFRLIKSSEFRLWICGGGVAEPLVKERASSDSRIKYYGLVNKQKVAQLQGEATLLINPRNPNGAYNEYSFPSKTMEYFASGTPTLMYKLDGVPEEYYQYCYTIEGNTVDGLSAAIYNNCQLNKDILKTKGKSAREFIIKNKNSVVQCKKVKDMLTSIEN
jgi:glycosyltransferase involved in cell wall biosynthesis